MSEAGKSKIRLGEALVQRGAMTEEQVKEVLFKQRERSGVDKLFGEIAVELRGYPESGVELIRSAAVLLK